MIEADYHAAISLPRYVRPMGRTAMLSGVTTLVAVVVSCATPPDPPADGRAPVVFTAKIGDIGDLGCPPDGDRGACDVAFMLTSIEQGVPCEPLERTDIGPDEQLVRFTIIVSTQPVFRHPEQPYDDALFVRNWLIEGQRGEWHQLTDHVSAHCRGDDISAKLVPGSRFTKSVLVTAPQPATTLLLSVDGVGWKWTVPPPPVI
jgi:hypothetical protein